MDTAQTAQLQTRLTFGIAVALAWTGAQEADATVMSAVSAQFSEAKRTAGRRLAQFPMRMTEETQHIVTAAYPEVLKILARDSQVNGRSPTEYAAHLLEKSGYTHDEAGALQVIARRGVAKAAKTATALPA